MADKRIKNRRSYKGKNNPNYKHGKPKCKDCGKQLKSYKTERCQKCHNIRIKGKNNSNYANKWTKEQKKKQGIITKKAMNNFGIRQRMIKNHADVSGKNNPMFGVHRFSEKSPSWIDGRSYEPYPIEFNKELKEKIRKRDDYTCQNCSMTEEEHIIVVGTVLNVHHIDYNKKNCKESNLITTCFWCNLRANKNRDYWVKYYRIIMEKKLCRKNV